MAKWIEIIEIGKKPKTSVYGVYAKEDKIILGKIAWFPRWRKYAFFPHLSTVFEQDCLKDICEFMDGLMTERKKIKSEKST